MFSRKNCIYDATRVRVHDTDLCRLQLRNTIVGETGTSTAHARTSKAQLTIVFVESLVLEVAYPFSMIWIIVLRGRSLAPEIEDESKNP